MKKKLGVVVALLLLTFFSTLSVHAGIITPTPVDVTLTSYFDATNPPITTDFTGVTAKTYGSSLTMDGSLASVSGYEFAFWIVNGVVRYDLAIDATFVMTDELELTGVFHPTSPLQYAVAFLDSNGQMIELQYVASGGNAVAPSTATLSKPGYTQNGWSLPYTNVTTNIATILQYTPIDSEATLTLTVTNGTGSGSYAFNSVATVTPNDRTGEPTPMYFNGWEDGNGVFVSCQSTYSFTVLESMTMTARYRETDPIVPTPVVTLSDKYSLRSGKSSFLGQFYIPGGYTLVEFGTLVSDSNVYFDLSTGVTTKHQGTKFFEETNEWLTSITATAGEFIKAYLVVENTSSHEFFSYYSPARSIKDLLISEYGEGSSVNKWIEIYNPSAYAADLSQYSLSLFTNGSATPSTTMSLSGSLASGDVYVIANSSSNAAILAAADTTNNTVINYNGDDALGLYHWSEVIDQFGVIGTDPGTAWTVGSGDTVDNTIVRIYNLDCPNAVFDTTEWMVYGIDTIAYIGYHENDPLESITITGSTSVMALKTISLGIDYSPLDGMHGVTWESSNESAATVNASGVVTGVAAGETTITATSTSNGAILDTQVITVVAAVYYTVTYEPNGGTAVSSEEVLDGSAATQPADPTYTGYVFNGWYTDNTTFEDLYVFSQAVVSEFTLFAKWTAEGGTVYASDLFISEYIEGSGTIRALEIYNGTGASVNLANYRIVNYYNGNATVTASYIYALSGTLSHGQVAVVYYTTGASAALIAAANTASVTLTTTSSAMNYNGDDAIALEKYDGVSTWNKVDVVGVIGTDPGTQWGVVAVNCTANMTLVRKATVTAGDSNFLDAFDPTVQWNPFAQDTFTYLGSHTME